MKSQGLDRWPNLYATTIIRLLPSSTLAGQLPLDYVETGVALAKIGLISQQVKLVDYSFRDIEVKDLFTNLASVKREIDLQK